jgi:hypothetical protein
MGLPIGCLVANMTAVSSKPTMKEFSSKMKFTSLCKLISKVTSHHLCWVLLGRSKLLELGHTEKEGITQGCKYLEVGIIGSYSEATYLTFYPLFPSFPSTLHHLIKLLKTHLSYQDFSSWMNISLTNQPGSWLTPSLYTQCTSDIFLNYCSHTFLCY